MRLGERVSAPWRALSVRLVALAGMMVLAGARPARADVESAYQREFAFLEAEKHALGKRIEQQRQESSAALEAGREAVDRLQQQVLSLSMRAERLAQTLTDVEREAVRLEENADVFSAVLAQMRSALAGGGASSPGAGVDSTEAGGASSPEAEADSTEAGGASSPGAEADSTEAGGASSPGAGVDSTEAGGASSPDVEADSSTAREQRLTAGFGRALKRLAELSSLRREQGEFFALDGAKVSGEIVHLGGIASFGVSARAAGALAPAGEGQLRIWPQGDTAAAARALVAGEARGDGRQLLPLFLYESLEQRAEVKQDKGALEVIESGGVIGWVIVAAGALALLMVVARALFLWRAARNTFGLLERITPLLERKEFEAASAWCQAVDSAGGRVLVATLQNLHRERAELEDVVSEAVLQEQPVLDRFGSAILVVAAVAPLLGLLGTVTGMIATFDIITEFGTGNPKLLSSGISIALVTTELGLIVAIPALVLGNLLSSWAERIKDGIDQAALRAVNVARGANLIARPSAPPGVDSVASDAALAAS